MKAAELKDKSIKELQVLLFNFKKELFNLRFQKVNGTLSNTARITIVKKSIARVNTFINQASSLLNGGNNA